MTFFLTNMWPYDSIEAIDNIGPVLEIALNNSESPPQIRPACIILLKSNGLR